MGKKYAPFRRAQMDQKGPLKISKDILQLFHTPHLLSIELIIKIPLKTNIQGLHKEILHIEVT
jgi:hypothetical protein